MFYGHLLFKLFFWTTPTSYKIYVNYTVRAFIIKIHNTNQPTPTENRRHYTRQLLCFPSCLEVLLVWFETHDDSSVVVCIHTIHIRVNIIHPTERKYICRTKCAPVSATTVSANRWRAPWAKQWPAKRYNNKHTGSHPLPASSISSAVCIVCLSPLMFSYWQKWQATGNAQDFP